MNYWKILRRFFIASVVLLLLTLVGGVLFFDRLLTRFRPQCEKLLSDVLRSEVHFAEIHLRFTPRIRLHLKDVEVVSQSTAPEALKFRGKASDMYLKLSTRTLLRRLPELLSGGSLQRLIDPHSLIFTKAEFKLVNAKQQAIEVSSTKNLELRFKRHSFEALGTSGGMLGVENMLLDVPLVRLSDGEQLAYEVHHVHLEGALNIGGSRLELSNVVCSSQARKLENRALEEVPVSIAVQKLSLHDDTGEVTVEKGAAQIAEMKLSIEGKGNFRNNTFDTQLQADKIDLTRIREWLPAALAERYPEKPFGMLSAKANVKLLGPDDLQASGELSLESLKFARPVLSAKSLNLKALEVTRSSKELKIASQVELGPLSITTTNREHYALTRLHGQIAMSAIPSGSMNFQSDLDITGFGYEESDVKLKDVDALLNSIKAKVAPDGSTEVTLNLDGKRVDFSADSIHVTKVEKVSAPITISVPAKGGYSVAGPVTVRQGSLEVVKRPLQEVNGTVDILVSSPLKRFVAKKLTAKSGTEDISLDAEFAINQTEYRLSKFSGKFAGAPLTGHFVLGRRDNKRFTTSVKLENARAEKIKTLLTPDEPSNLVGLLKIFTADIQATKGDLLKTMHGKGSFDFMEGLIENVYTDSTFKGIVEGLPVIGAKVAPRLKQGVDRLTKAPEDRVVVEKTAAKRLSADFTVAGRTAKTQNLVYESDYYTVKGAGTYSLDDGAHFVAVVVFLEQTARSLAGPIPMLSDFFGSLGRIEIPVIITGKGRDLSVATDKKRLMSVSAPTRAARDLFGGVISIFSSNKDKQAKKDKEVLKAAGNEADTVVTPVQTPP